MDTIPPRGATEVQRDRAIRELIQGRSNATGSVTLTANQATTAVSRETFSSDAQVFLFPRTANAAAELGAGTLFVSTVANQSFTVTHANNAQTDRTFGFIVIGG